MPSPPVLVDLDRHTKSRLQSAGWSSATPCMWPPNGSGSHYEFQTSLLHHQPRTAAVPPLSLTKVVRGHLGIEDSRDRGQPAPETGPHPSGPPSRAHESCGGIALNILTALPRKFRSYAPIRRWYKMAERNPAVQTVLDNLTILQPFWTGGRRRPGPHTGTRPCRHLAYTVRYSISDERPTISTTRTDSSYPSASLRCRSSPKLKCTGCCRPPLIAMLVAYR